MGFLNVQQRASELSQHVRAGAGISNDVPAFLPLPAALDTLVRPAVPGRGWTSEPGTFRCSQRR